MKKVTLFLALLTLLAVGFSFAAGPSTIKGVQGKWTGAPRVVNLMSLPHLDKPYVGPKRQIYAEHEEAGDEDQASVMPPPDIRTLQHVTLDPTSEQPGNNNPTAPVQVGAGINGISQGGYIPTEPSVASGPYNIFTTGNSSVVVVNKDGSNRVETDGLVFFGGNASEGGMSDAVCYYDARHGHFVATAFSTDATTFSWLYVAVSQTNDARGAWWTYRFDGRVENGSTTSNFVDYEDLGVSDDKLAISMNKFSLGTTNTFQHEQFRVWALSQIYSGSASTYWDYIGSSSAPPFCSKVARNMSVGNTIYIYSTVNTGGSAVSYGTITGTVAGGPTLTMGGSTIACQAYGLPAGSYHHPTGGTNGTNPYNCVVGGSTAYTVNDASDCRSPNSVVVRNGFLHTAFHFGTVITPDTVDAIRYQKFDLSTSPWTLVTDETYARAGTWMYYPGVIVDSVGTVFLGFGRSSKTEYPSSYVTGKRRNDATFQASTLAKAGNAVLSTGYARWGDFTMADMDESASGPGGSTAWYAGQATLDASDAVNWLTRMYYPYSQVQGHAYLDLDGNTLTSGDRRPISGWTVTLKQGVTTLQTTTTDASGAYSFGYLETGTYLAVLTPQAGNTIPLDVVTGTGGNTQTKIDNLTIQISLTTGNTAQTSTGNDFLEENQNAAISGYLYNDLNQNGARDAGEGGLSGWTINLSGTGSASTTTDATGYYTFLNVPVGSYTVAEVLQPGYTQSAPVGGTYSVTITTGSQQVTGQDFGDYISTMRTWTGNAGTNNWGDAGNWFPTIVPTLSNDVTITSASTVNINVPAVCNNFLLQNVSAVVTIQSGNALTVGGNFAMNSGALYTQTAFPTISGTTTIAGGTIGFTAASGSQTVPALTYSNLIIDGGGTKTFAGTTSIGGDLTVNGGTLNMAGQSYTLTGALAVAGGATLQTGGSVISTLTNVTLGATSTVVYSGAAENLLNITYGNLTVSGSGTKTMPASLTVNGVLTLSQTITAGTYTLTLGPAGSVIRSTGYVIGAFTKTISGTGTATWELGTAASYLPAILNISALSGSGPVTVTLVASNPATVFTGDVSKAIGHYYSIAINASITAMTAIPSMSFSQTEFNALTGTGSDQTKLFLARWNNAAWVSQRTNSTLSVTASGGTPGQVSLLAGVSQFSPWGIFWGTTDAPLSPPTLNVKTWVGSGASGGNGSTDFNAAANWSPTGTPSAADSCVMNFIAGSFSPAVTADITIGALYVNFVPSGTTEEDVLFETPFNLTIQGSLTGEMVGASGAIAHSLQFIAGTTSGGNGSISVNGKVFLGRNTATTYGVWLKGIAGSYSTLTFRGDSVIYGQSGRNSAANIAQSTVFDGPGTQILRVDNATAGVVNMGNLIIGRTNTPTVILAGSGAQINMNAAATLGCDLTIRPGATLDLGTRTVNRSAAGGTLTIGAGGTLRVGGSSLGMGVSNFPLNWSTYAIDPAAIVEYYGTSAQTVCGTIPFGNLTVTGAATRTDSLTTTVRGNLTVNTGATFAANTYTLNLAGNLVGNGTYNGMTGTMVFNGTSGQTISGSTAPGFNNLTVSNSAAPISLSTNIGVAGTLSVGAGSIFSPGATVVMNSGGAAGAISGSGTVQVTRTAATADFANQYKFTTNTLTSMTVDYAGAGAQTINSTVGTYGVLKTSGSGTKTLGGAVTDAGPLTIGSGTTLDVSASNYALNVGGNWTNNGTFTPQSGTVTLNGSSAQTVGGSSATTFSGLTVSNTAGAILGTNATVNGALTLGANKITTGINTLSIGSAGSVSRTTGYVNGLLQKYINTGAAAPTFEIGDASNYSPAAITFGNVSTGGNLLAKTTSADHPSIGTSTINSSSDVNRYWTLTNNGIVFNNYSATFTYVSGDVDAGATPTSFGVEKYDAPNWTAPTLGTVTSTSAQATGMTSFSDFAVGQIYGMGDNPAPLISTLAPASINAGSGTFTDTLNGTGFISGSTVTFRGASVAVLSQTTTQLVVSIPAAAVANGGLWPMVVTNPAPGGGTSAPVHLTVNHLAPTTTSTSPASGNQAGSTFTLTVNGTGFDSSSVVQFAGSSRTTTFINATQVTASIPSTDLAVSGSYNITVVNPTPAGGTSNAQVFQVFNNVPTTTNTSPASTTGGGSQFTLTVNGTNFVSNSVVLFNGNSRTTAFVNATQLTATILATDIQVPGSYPVTVLNPAPGGGTSNAQTFTVTTPTGITRTWTSTNTGGDWNTAANWTPNGIPTVTDSVIIKMLNVSATITMSGNAFAGALVLKDSITSTTARTLLLNPQGYTLDIKGSTMMFTPGSNGSTNSYVTIGDPGGSSTPSTLIFEGALLMGTTGYTSNNNITLTGISGTRVTMNGNVTLGIRASTKNAGLPDSYTFDGTGTQTVTISNTANAFLFSNVIIGQTNSPNVVLAGTGTLSTISGGLTLNNSSILDYASGARWNATGVGDGITMAAGTKLRVGGTTGGQTGSNFPSNFSVFNFDAASTVEYYGSGQTIYNGPLYGNLMLTSSGTKTAGGALSVMGDLTIGSGATFAAGTSLTHTIGGNFSNSGTFSYTTANTMVFAGTGSQSIGGSTATSFYNITDSKISSTLTLGASATIAGTLTLSSGPFAVGSHSLTLNGPTIAGTPASLTTTSGSTLAFGGSSTGVSLPGSVATLSGLTVNNANGLTLNGNLTVGGTLTLTNGAVITGSNALAIGSSGSVSRTSGFVQGNLQKYVSAGSGVSRTFEIGGSSGYRPVSVTFGNVGTAGNLTATVTTSAANHPNIGTAGIDGTKDVPRWWTLTNSGVGFDNYGLTLNYLAADYGSANYANFIIRKYNGTWAGATTGTRTTTSTQATGFTTFSDFIVGEPVSHTITASAGANGSISPSGAVSVPDAGSQGFTISPNTGYHIADVLVDGASQGAIGSYTFTNVTTDHTISASFAINTYTITATSSANGSISPSGTVPVTYGSSQGFTITPNTGYRIDSVVVDGANQGAIGSYTFSSIAANHTIAAYFSINMYTITATAAANGSITPSGAVSVAYGGSQAFTIAANTNYHIDSVVVDGVNQGAVTGYSFSSVAANHAIGAYFSIDQYTITATAGPNGSIAPSGPVQVNAGSNQTFNFTPLTGYHVDSLIVDGVPRTPAGSYTFNTTLANHTIRVAFANDQYTITASAGSHGSISPSGAVSVNYNSGQLFTFTPETGYHVSSVTVDDAPAVTASSYQFDNVVANHTIAVAFAIDQFTITASAGSNGSISPPGASTVDYGGSQLYTITPSTGYHVDSMVIDGVNHPELAGSSYTFSTVTANHTLYITFAINQYTVTASAGLHGAIAPAGTTTVSYGDSVVYTITSDEGYHVSDVVVDGSSIGPVTSYTFRNIAANHTIVVSFTISGYTITASSNSGGTIDPSGSISIEYGSDTTFTLTPNTGYHIDSLFVDGSPIPAVGSYTFTSVSTNHTIRVKFAIDQFTITASAGANGLITPSGAVVVDYDASRQFDFTPATGYHVDSVIVDGVAQPATANYQFTHVTANHTIAATFAINTFTVTTSAGTNGTVSPLGAQTVNYGDSLVVTITPAAGYHVAEVLVDGGSVGAVTSYTFRNITAVHTLSASFAIDQFTITATVGAHGAISPSGAVTVNYGGSQTFSLTPATGYHVDSLIVDGLPQAVSGSYAFTNVTASHTIHAAFAIDQFTIMAPAGANGTISPSGSIAITYGASQSFTISPMTGYHIADVLVDEVSVGAVPSYLFSNVAANHSISASFAIDSFTITASVTGNGTLTPAGASKVAFNGSLLYTIAPATGSHTLDVAVDGVSQGPLTQYNFTSVQKNHTISASFGIDSFTITASSGPNGAISPLGAAIVLYGGNQGYTFTPATGYHIDSVIVDGTAQALTSPYTFNGVSASHTIRVTFAINAYTITSTADANGAVNPSGARSVNYGDSLVVAVTPSTGYHVADVLIDGISAGPITSYAFRNVTASHTLSAAFAINTFTITATAGSNGAITPSGVVTVNYGATQVFTIAPATGYHIDSLIVDGVNLPIVTVDSFKNVIADHTIRAVFKINRYTITATTGPNGTVTPNGVILVPYGSNQAFNFIAETGYHIDSILIDGVSQPITASDTFKNVAADHTLRVVYAINRYVVTASAGPHGTITPLGAASVAYGADQTFSIHPAIGYHIDTLKVDDAVVAADTNYTFANVTVAHSIAVTFAINSYTIAVSVPDAHGSITPSGVVTVNYGADAPFSILPLSGYKVDSLYIDGVGQAGAVTYTFTAVSGNHTISASFALLPTYQVRYRTFPYDSLIVAKAIKKKPTRDYFEFKFPNNTGGAVTELHLAFSNDVTSLSAAPSFTITSVSKKVWTLTGGILANGEIMSITGYSPKAKVQVISKLWLGPQTTTPTVQKLAANKNQFLLPMPNVANVRDYLYTNALQAHGGLVVGLVRTDSSKYLGWVRMKKSGDLYKSLTDKSGPHSAINHGFVTLTNGKAFVKELTSLPPLKQNDRTFADLLALKFNIALSALGVTEGGFGELLYTEAGNPFAGMLVRDIALKGDSMMTLALWQKWHENAPLYGKLDTALLHINNAFAGSIDTVSWGSGLQLTGTVRLIDAGILSATGIAPAVMAQAVTEGGSADADVPERAMLYQNYPNPFNPATTIKFDLPEDAVVSLRVYNMLGQQVGSVLKHENMSAGSREVRFDAGRLSSGVYFYRLNVEPVTDEDGMVIGRSFISVKKMLLVK